MYELSIVTITFNHEKFIAKCIRSIISQKTNFRYQLIISDDASQDNTAKIIEQFQIKYPGKIKFIKKEINIGAYENYVSTLSLVNSSFVVICEGDDYFCNENKLQIQYDYLINNPDKSICFHPVKVVHPGFFNKFKKKIFPKSKTRFFKNDLNINDLLMHNFMQTNSVMYRWRFKNGEDFKNNFPKNIMPCDYYLHLLHAQIGEIGFIDKIMSAYRIWEGGIWYNTDKDLTKHVLKHGINQLNFIIEVAKNIATDKYFYLKKNKDFVKKIIEILIENNKDMDIKNQIEFLKNFDIYNDI